MKGNKKSSKRPNPFPANKKTASFLQQKVSPNQHNALTKPLKNSQKEHLKLRQAAKNLKKTLGTGFEYTPQQQINIYFFEYNLCIIKEL
jgi:hypothetical protein